MPEIQNGIYDETVEFIDLIVEDSEFIQNLMATINKGDVSISLNRKVLKKQIDNVWVETVESLLPALDYALRHTGRDIQEGEKILPIELSRNITARSVQHLSQHTDMINRIEKDGTVIPSKLLNVYRDEKIDTYENKFINTLVHRLFAFITVRYEKLAENGRDENGSELDISVDMNTGNTDVKMSLKIETKNSESSPQSQDESEKGDEDSLWERVCRLKKNISGYMSFPFIVQMGKAYIRPPIMRTNAIMKNIYLKQCLNLWQFIESYDKLGFEIDAKETAEKPDDELVRQLYSLLAIQYMIYRYNTEDEPQKENIRKTRKTTKSLSPRIVREFEEEFVEDYNYYNVERKKVLAVYPGVNKKKLSPDEIKIKSAISKALTQEKKHRAHQKRLEDKKKLKNNK